jgi:hypothetical protein
MTDKELLEMAAKASGLKCHFANDAKDSCMFFDNPKTPGIWGSWNPLTDDGDAFRLAVGLGMYINMYDSETKANVGVSSLLATEVYAKDKCAATRRAIVRAAAAIGMAMA